MDQTGSIGVAVGEPYLKGQIKELQDATRTGFTEARVYEIVNEQIVILLRTGILAPGPNWEGE